MVVYYCNLDAKALRDNKRFWSSIKPFFCGKIVSKDKLILIKK